MIITASLIATAWWLTPAAAGVGTHQQLGLPPCGFLIGMGLPCATCGMTTAFAYAADGQVIRAFMANPAGALLAIVTTMLMILSAAALYLGFSIWPVVRGLWGRHTILFGIGVFLTSWGYKMLVVRGMI